MTDQDVMENFVRIVGHGKLNGPRNHNYKDGCTRKPTYRWSIRKRTEVIRILELFSPFFGQRRGAKAMEALYHYETLN